MSFFSNLRADRLVSEIRSSNDPQSPATQKAIAKLKDAGPAALDPIFAALPESQRTKVEAALVGRAVLERVHG